MRILFIGTGDIGLPSLEALLTDSGQDVIGLVSQPDKPVGRKMLLTPPRVKERAVAAGIPVLQPRQIRKAGDELAAFSADVFVVVAYGQILPRSVLDLPSRACLNIHASLLPRHRGAAPIQAAIREGDAETGVTIMWMDEGLDTGDVLIMEKVPILPTDTGAALHDRLAALAPQCLLRALSLIDQGCAPRMPQDNSLATYAGKLGREDGRINWTQGATEIERMIRAFQPWPGTFCLLPQARGTSAHLKVNSAAVVEDAQACPIGGAVLSACGRLLVSCGRGVLELLEVQLEGRKRLSAREFLQGHSIPEGTILG